MSIMLIPKMRMASCAIEKLKTVGNCNNPVVTSPEMRQFFPSLRYYFQHCKLSLCSIVLAESLLKILRPYRF